MSRTQLRLAQITGSFKDAEGGIIDTLPLQTSGLSGLTVNSGSLVGVFSEIASAVKRINGGTTFAGTGAGILQDQNGDVQGQVHKLALSGRSFLDVGTGQPRGIPGPGSVYVAVDLGNPNNNRIFMTEAEAAVHLDKSLKKRKVNINKVKTNLVPNLPQENFLQNIRSEVNRIIQENPNILNQVNPNIIEMNNDEQLRIIEAEFLEDAKLLCKEFCCCCDIFLFIF